MGTINPNKARVYFDKTGVVLENVFNDRFNPNSNLNTYQVNIEDGGGENTIALINYQTEDMRLNSDATVSHWYPLAFLGMNNYKISGEVSPRAFAQYLTFVPVNVLNRNLGKNTPMTITCSVKLIGGINFLGLFDSIEDLEAEYPASEELDEQYAIAGIYDNETGDVIYYQVRYDSEGDVYEWVEDDVDHPILALLESKQYNEFTMIVQPGKSNNALLPLELQHYQLLYNLINNLGSRVASVENAIDAVVSLYQNTIQSVEDTTTVDLTLTDDYPNGKKLKADVKIDESKNDLLRNVGNGLYVGNGDVSDLIKEYIESPAPNTSPTEIQEALEWYMVQKINFNNGDVNSALKDLIHAEALTKIMSSDTVILSIDDGNLRADLRVDPSIDNTIEIGHDGVRVAGLKTSAGVQYTLDQILDMISITILDE